VRPYCSNFYDDAIEMLDAHRNECDAVFLVTGIASHEYLALAAAERGYHIWLEKPPAATIQEVDRMIAAVDAAGVVCQVAFRWIWSSDINFMKDRIVDGRLGRIKSVVNCAGWPRRDYYYSRNEWAGKLRSGDNWVLDGPATNALAHQTSNVLYLGSPEPGGFATPTFVRAELYSARDIESHDTAAIEIQTAEGIPLHFLVSHCSETEFGPVIEVHGEKGTGRWTFAEGPVVTYCDGSEERSGREEELGRDKMVANFVQAVESGDPKLPKCTLADTRNYTLVADGMHESSGRIHRIDKSFVRRSEDEGDRGYTIVDGLDDALKRAAAKRCVFSDLDDPPTWAVSTERFDLESYTEFPQRFQSE
jgi:predicted dehydrogenase